MFIGWLKRLTAPPWPFPLLVDLVTIRLAFRPNAGLEAWVPYGRADDVFIVGDLTMYDGVCTDEGVGEAHVMAGSTFEDMDGTASAGATAGSDAVVLEDVGWASEDAIHARYRSVASEPMLSSIVILGSVGGCDDDLTDR